MDKTLWPAFSSLPGEKDLQFKFFVDAGNAPTLAPAPYNNYITSVVRTSQGLYTVTLSDAARSLQAVTCELALNTPGAVYAQPGPSTNFGVSVATGLPTVVIYTLNAGNVADPPAANANVFISGTICFTDASSQ